MVVYDLICSRGHRFEGWFAGLDDLEEQLGKRRIACPVCGDEAVNRRPSTFGVVKSGRTEAPAPPAEGNGGGGGVEAAGSGAAGGGAAEGPLAFFQRWREFSAHLEKEFDDVGSRFAEEALKMHYGVTSRRNIRGMSTDSQEEMLRKEGVDFLKVPLLVKKQSSHQDN
jgi:hypothetical protein